MPPSKLTLYSIFQRNWKKCNKMLEELSIGFSFWGRLKDGQHHSSYSTSFENFVEASLKNSHQKDGKQLCKDQTALDGSRLPCNFHVSLFGPFTFKIGKQIIRCHRGCMDNCMYTVNVDIMSANKSCEEARPNVHLYEWTTANSWMPWGVMIVLKRERKFPQFEFALTICQAFRSIVPLGHPLVPERCVHIWITGSLK